MWSQPSAIGCLREATEYYIIEYSVYDTYVPNAMKHRVIVMPKDMQALRLVRYRYDKTLRSISLAYTKMDFILKIPLVFEQIKEREDDIAPVSRQTYLNTSWINVEETSREVQKDLYKL